jgi:hypothetical protein
MHSFSTSAAHTTKFALSSKTAPVECKASPSRALRETESRAAPPRRGYVRRCSGAIFAPGIVRGADFGSECVSATAGAPVFWGAADGKSADSFGNGSDALPLRAEGETDADFGNEAFPLRAECSGAIFAPRMGGTAADGKSADSFGNGSDALPLRGGDGRGFRKRGVSATGGV